MKPRRKLLVSAVALSIVAVTAGGAFADNKAHNETNDQVDVQMMMKAKITLASAIQAAEGAQGGKAVSAAYEGNNGQAAYQVEVAAADGKTTSVLIDGDTGKVLKTSIDTQDGNNGDNEQAD
jgi:uncharacterized membrane protein YkoI